MNPNAPLPAPNRSPAAFEDVVDAAFREGASPAAQAAMALAQGLDLQGLLRYAAGAASAMERRALEPVLARTPWATRAVSTLVRAGRAQGGLGRALLDAARAGAVDAGKVVARVVLAERGRGDLPIESPTAAETDAAVRGALLLGRGQAEDAETTLGRVERPTALTDLARRVAASRLDPDQALLLVVQAL